jgi:hypothetical protein
MQGVPEVTTVAVIVMADATAASNPTITHRVTLQGPHRLVRVKVQPLDMTSTPTIIPRHPLGTDISSPLPLGHGPRRFLLHMTSIIIPPWFPTTPSSHHPIIITFKVRGWALYKCNVVVFLKAGDLWYHSGMMQLRISFGYLTSTDVKGYHTRTRNMGRNHHVRSQLTKTFTRFTKCHVEQLWNGPKVKRSFGSTLCRS